MSTMSIDIWSEPLAEPVANVAHLDNDEGGTRPSKHNSLFLSDSEDDDMGGRKDDSTNVASPPKDSNAPSAPEAFQLNAMFDDLDDDDEWTVEPALDIEQMKRQTAVRVAASTPAAKSLGPSLTPDSTVNNGDSTKVKDEKVKKARRALPKLDEERLLGNTGFPRLLKEYKTFKVAGKGHEVADVEKLFRLYHGWTHRMYPKFQFRDTVERVEKLCRSRRMGVNMRAWKDEAHGIASEERHEITQGDDENGGEDGEDEEDDAVPTRVNHAGPEPPSSPSSSRPSTPVTRPGSAASIVSSIPSSATDDGMDVDIEALLREEEEMMREINGAGKGPTSYKPSDPVDEDELWVSAGEVPDEFPEEAPLQKSIGPTLPPREEVDDDDLWDIAAQLEADTQAKSKHQSRTESNNQATVVPADGSAHSPADPPTAPKGQPSVGGDWDDMYA